MDALAHHLADHRFAELFRDELGWDHVSGAFVIDVDERQLSFQAVAQKRGFQVLHCNADRLVLLNKGLLRRAQRKIARSIHEHILIFASDVPRKQVWQWAVRRPDGRRLRHREHPFFSASPPVPFLSRLSGLQFSLDEEADVTLVDALDRVRRVLDVSADQNLFARRPWYAERSDELAVAMQNGDASAFDRFIVLHLPLARKISRRLRFWFDMLPEDAEQIAVIGLIQAGRRFRPELGFQFSTYATWWVRKACQRFGPDFALLIRVPQHIFWDCFPRRYELERIHATGGPAAVRDWLSSLEVDDPKLGVRLRAFHQATSIVSISDRCQPEYLEVRHRAQSVSESLDGVVDSEKIEIVRTAIAQLNPRQAQIIRLRYGIGCAEHTLEELGAVFHVTRERVRQIQIRAEEKLERILKRTLPAADRPHAMEGVTEDEGFDSDASLTDASHGSDIQDFEADTQENPG